MAKLVQTKNLGGKKKKTWKFDAGFWGTHQQAQGFYLPTFLDEPFCLDPYILGYLLIGRRVGTQNGGSEEDLGIPTLSFFSFCCCCCSCFVASASGGKWGRSLRERDDDNWSFVFFRSSCIHEDRLLKTPVVLFKKILLSVLCLFSVFSGGRESHLYVLWSLVKRLLWKKKKKRGVSDGGKAEGTERSNRRRNGSRSSTNLGRLGGEIGETVSTVLRGILFSLHLVLRVFFGCSSVLFDMLSCFVYASAIWRKKEVGGMEFRATPLEAVFPSLLGSLLLFSLVASFSSWCSITTW